MIRSTDEASEQYDVCLSFAAEQRNYVEEVAELLRDTGVRVFYDSYETADLWGRDLYAHLDEIYNRRSTFCVLFASAAYREKVWTNHERASAQDRALRDSAVYILPVRFDDSEIPGLRGSIGYIDARRTTPAELVGLLLSKLTMNRSATTESVLALAHGDVPVDTAQLLRSAMDNCGIDAVHHRSSENGVTAAVTTAPAVQVLTVLVPAIEAVLDEHNAHVPDDDGRVDLRIAVHRGEVPAGPAWNCASVTTATTIAQAPAGNEILAAAPRAQCVVIVSQRLYAETVAPGPRGITPSNYSKIALPAGETGWAKVTGYPKLPVPASADTAPAPPTKSAATPSAKYLFSGNTMTVGNIGDNSGPIHPPTPGDDRA